MFLLKARYVRLFARIYLPSLAHDTFRVGLYQRSTRYDDLLLIIDCLSNVSDEVILYLYLYWFILFCRKRIVFRS